MPATAGVWGSGKMGKMEPEKKSSKSSVLLLLRNKKASAFDSHAQMARTEKWPPLSLTNSISPGLRRSLLLPEGEFICHWQHVTLALLFPMGSKTICSKPNIH